MITALYLRVYKPKPERISGICLDVQSGSWTCKVGRIHLKAAHRRFIIVWRQGGLDESGPVGIRFGSHINSSKAAQSGRSGF